MRTVHPIAGHADISREDLTGLLKRWLSVSESQLCSLEVLSAQLPEVNRLLDSSFSEISENFVEIAGQFDACAKWVEAMAARDPSPEGAEALAAAQDIARRLGGLIMSLQFQDRVSQNLVITINVVRAVADYLQTEIDATIGALAHADERARLDVDFAKRLMSLLNLGELKHRFVGHLLTHGYIRDAAEVGYEMREAAAGEDDIDLF